MNSKAKHPQSRHTGKKAELDNKGFIEFCSKCGRKTAKRFLWVKFCYYCDLGNSG